MRPGQAPDGLRPPGSGGEPQPPRTRQCRQCLAFLPYAAFARMPGDKRAKVCDPCELAHRQAEADGSPWRCRACREVRPLDQFPGDGTRAHGLLCETCLAVLRRRAPESQPSLIRDLPRAAFFAHGLCADPKTLRRFGAVWTSDFEADRQTARRLCRSCAVSLLCADWSLSLPRDDNSIYAAMGRADRRRLRGRAGTASA